MARTKRISEEPQEQTTALALPDEPILIAAFSDETKMESVLKRIETDALSIAPDLSTATSRKAIASLAYKVARSKTALDDVGKAITEEARKTVDAVNAKRRDVRERLEGVQKQVRAPLDEWEAAEAARIADLEDRLKDFSEDLPGLDAGRDEIVQTIKEIEGLTIDDSWDEFKGRAAAAKDGTLTVLFDMLEKAIDREAERAELERLRAEAAARDEADRQRQAEERRKAEADRIEREKAEAVERAARAAEERAKAAEERAAREKAETEERHKRELAEAERMAEFKLNEERNRQARIKAGEDEARAKREADKARRTEVFEDMLNALRELDFSDDAAVAVATFIMAGKVPHVKVEM